MRLRRSSESGPFRDGLFFILALALAAVLAACGRAGDRESDPAAAETPGRRARPTVTEGMTMGEVLAAWGEPDLKVRQRTGERWSYWVRDGSSRVVAKAYVVFGADEKVAEVVTGPDDRDPPPPPRDPVRAT